MERVKFRDIVPGNMLIYVRAVYQSPRTGITNTDASAWIYDCTFEPVFIEAQQSGKMLGAMKSWRHGRVNKWVQIPALVVEISPRIDVGSDMTILSEGFVRTATGIGANRWVMRSSPV